MDDLDLDLRLAAARSTVQRQNEMLRDLRRRLRTTHAHSAALCDSAIQLAGEARRLMTQAPLPHHPRDGDV